MAVYTPVLKTTTDRLRLDIDDAELLRFDVARAPRRCNLRRCHRPEHRAALPHLWKIVWSALLLRCLGRRNRPAHGPVIARRNHPVPTSRFALGATSLTRGRDGAEKAE